jgi:hypothetical protein
MNRSDISIFTKQKKKWYGRNNSSPLVSVVLFISLLVGEYNAVQKNANRYYLWPTDNKC